jgi:DNA-binding MarR family transcriptional regulator
MIASPEAPEKSRDEELRLVAARCFVRATRRAANLVTRVYNGHFKAADLEATQFWTLSAIAEGSARSLTELAQSLGVEKSTLKRSLDVMMAAGLVAPDPQRSGRRLVHHLTSLGHEKLEAGMPLWANAQAEIERLLPQARAEEITTSLRALRAQAHRVFEHSRSQPPAGTSGAGDQFASGASAVSRRSGGTQP